MDVLLNRFSKDEIHPQFFFRMTKILIDGKSILKLLSILYTCAPPPQKKIKKINTILKLCETTKKNIYAIIVPPQTKRTS